MTSIPEPAALPGLVRSFEAIAEWLGRALAWLCLAMALATTLVVLLRYGFELGGTVLQEAVLYLHALVFWIGSAYTLKHEAHVRVDILYRRFSPTARAWVDCLGCILFLWPLCVFLFVSSWDFVATSWRIMERSSEAAGLPFLFLFKSLIPIGAALLALQGLAKFLRDLAVLVYGEREEVYGEQKP